MILNMDRKLMKNYFKKIVRLFFIFQLIIVMTFESAIAGKVDELILKVPLLPMANNFKLKLKGMKSAEDLIQTPSGDGVSYIWVKAKDLKVHNEEYLRQFAPKNVTSLVDGGQQQIRIWQAEYMKQMQKDLAKKPGVLPAALRGVFPGAIEFATSSLAFFFAIGFLQFKDLLLNYAENPAALYAHLEQEKDPVSRFAFYTFMMGSRGTTKILVNLLGAPQLAKIIPALHYIGMSMGMYTQQITAEVLNPLKSCVKELNDRRLSTDNLFPICDKAYDELVIGDKLIEGIPDLVSMLLSAMASSKIQQKAVKGFARLNKTAVVEATKKVGAKVVEKIGVSDLLTAFIPAGVLAWPAKFFLEFAAAEIFLSAKEVITPYVVPPWQNVVEGADLANVSQNLLSGLIDLKTQKWSTSHQNCNESYGHFGQFVKGPMGLPLEKEKCLKAKPYDPTVSFVDDLIDFQKLMGHWREINLVKTQEAMTNWGLKIMNLTNTYDASFNFYQYMISLIDSLSKNKNKKPEEKVTDPFVLFSPYNGVEPMAPAGFEEFPKDYILTQPSNYQLAQKKKILKEVVSKMELNIYQGAIDKVDPIKDNGPIDRIYMTSEFRNLYKKLMEQLKSPKVEDNVEALLKIRELAGYGINPIQRMPETFRVLLDELIELLGGVPDPIMYAGKGFTNAFEVNEFYAMHMNDMKFAEKPGPYPLQNTAEYLIYQMICGENPDGKESNLIETHYGRQDLFYPPRIRVEGDRIKDFCDPIEGSHFTNKDFYTRDIPVYLSDGRFIRYKGPLEYLRDRIRPDLLGTVEVPHDVSSVGASTGEDDKEEFVYEKPKISKKSVFQIWWTEQVDRQIRGQMKNYEKDYNVVVGHLMADATYNRSIKEESYLSKRVSDENVEKNSQIPEYRKTFNGGPIANGTIYSMLQEMRFYVLTLNELLRDTWLQKLPPAERASFVIEQKGRRLEHPSLANSTNLYFPLMQYLMVKQPFDLGTLLLDRADNKSLHVPPVNPQTIKFLEVFHDQFETTARAFINIGSKKLINDNMEKVNLFKTKTVELENLTSLIVDGGQSDEKWSHVKFESSDNIVKTLTTEQGRIYMLCMAKLKQLTLELQGYGLGLMTIQKYKLDKASEQIWEKGIGD